MKKTRISIALATALALVLLLGGCWDKQELDKLSIVTGLGIDAGESEGEIDLCLQVGNIKKEGGDKGKEKSQPAGSVKMLHATDRSVSSAIESLRYSNTREIFLHHNKVVLFGEEQAKRGIETYLDFFMRDFGSRMEIWIIVAEGRTDEVLAAEAGQEPISAMGLQQLIVSETGRSDTLDFNMLHFANRLLSGSTGPVAPIVKVVGEKEQARLELAGMAVFRKDTMVGRLNRSQAEGYAWVMGRNEKGIVNIDNGQDRCTLRVIHSRCRIRPVVEASGMVSVTVEIEAELSIQELQGYENAAPKQMVEQLVQEAAKQIEEQVHDCFETSRLLNSDILGIGEEIHCRHPKQWEQLSQNWDRIYPTLNFGTQIGVRLDDTGKMTGTLDAKGQME